MTFITLSMQCLRWLAVPIAVSLIVACTKTNSEKPPPPAQPSLFFITEVYDTSTYVGMMINDPHAKTQYALFGPKDTSGRIDTIIHLVEKFPENDGWLAHEFDENYLPTKTTTSTGHTIEYDNLNMETKTGSVVVKETSSGTVLWQTDDLPLSDDFGKAYEEADKIRKSPERKKRNKKAEMAYLGANMAGCAMGAASLGAGGPLAIAWGLYNTYQSCKSVADALGNLYNGKPAFGCVSGQDHANAFSGIGEAMHFGTSLAGTIKNGMPTAMGYLSQMAGQDGCGGDDDDPLQPPPLPELPPRDIGSSWGDPHLATLDGFFYDFHGYGEFIAAKSLADNFEVQVRLGNPYVNNPLTTYNVGIAVQTGGDKVCFIAGPWKLYVNNVEQSLNFSSIPLQQGASITKATNGTTPEIIIKHKNGDLVKIRLTMSTYFDYSVQLTESRKGKMEGLLGNYDGDENNDLKLRTGEKIEKKFSDLYPGFANSWRISNDKSLFYYNGGQSTTAFTRTDLPVAPVTIPYDQYAAAETICLDAGIKSEPFLCNCIVDVATSGDPATTASSFAQQEMDSIPRFPGLDMNGIQLKGDATFVNNSIRLTRNAIYLAGQAFKTEALQGDFETSFVFRMGLSNNGGADGIALVIAKEIPGSVSNPYPGKSGKLGYEGIPNSLAVEFDTYMDVAGDGSNHAAIHTNGTGANSTGATTRINMNKNIAQLDDGMFHKIKVIYKNNKLQVWMDGTMIMENVINLAQTLGLAGSFYLGLTSSTSHSSEAHYIDSWEVKQL